MARSLSPASPIALVLVAACALACAPQSAATGPAVTFDPCTPVTLAPDATTSAAELQGIAAAAALWNQTAGSALAMIATAPMAATAPATAPAPAMATAPSSPDGGVSGLPIHFQTAATPIHGLYDAPSGQVFINNDLSGSQLSITIAHEIGHAFGLVHVPPAVRPSLMNPGNLTVSITPEDVATLAALWGRCPSLDAAGAE